MTTKQFQSQRTCAAGPLVAIGGDKGGVGKSFQARVLAWQLHSRGIPLALLNARLSESPWMAGDAFSLADITAFVFTDFARVVKMRPPEDHAATQAWLDRMRARPAAAL